jgi:hypothetical protein
VTRTRKISLCVFVLIICLGIFQTGIRPGWAQPLTYTIQKGDTLWDICEKVYGDADLWPKLWEMNPFITNPHLLKPGDVITLLEGVPVLKNAPVSMAKKIPSTKISAPPVVFPRAYDLSSIKDMDGLGYLSTNEVVSLGAVVSGNREKIMLGAGETLFAQMAGSSKCAPGDRFTVCKISSLLKDPVTGEDLGYLVSNLGRIRILEPVRGNLFKALIEKSFRTIRTGDPLLKYVPASSCIEPVKAPPEVSTYIAAIEEQKVMVGQYTTVYFLKGSMQGIQPGQVFQILQKREAKVPTDDTQSQETVMLPDALLGYCLVLRTTADTGTGVVMSAKRDIPNGALMRTLGWTKPPAFLSAVPACRAQ